MTYVIAEAGINHNGDINLAKRLAYVSMISGADAVKFQTFWDMGRLSEYELSKEEFVELSEHCKDLSIDFMTTPHTIGSIDFVDTLVSVHKIASPFLLDEAFIKKVASKGKPILLSTGSLSSEDGMASLSDIETALSWLRESGMDKQTTLLHCVSKYPCLDPHVERITELERFGLPVGISDHSKTMEYKQTFPVIEKHIMLHCFSSIDSNVSLYPDEFRYMVNKVRVRDR